jgi:zinc protease
VEQKLATDAGASYDGDARDSGEFSVYAVPRPGVTLDQVERAVDAVLAPLLAAPPSAGDLARVKVQLVAGEVYKRDSQLTLATAYGQALVNGLSPADVQDWPRRVNALSAATVHNTAAAFLNRREAVTLYLMPSHA